MVVRGTCKGALAVDDGADVALDPRIPARVFLVDQPERPPNGLAVKRRVISGVYYRNAVDLRYLLPVMQALRPIEDTSR